jgi:hypothetical protein
MPDTSTPRASFEALPKCQFLFPGPSPVQKLERLSKRLGGATVWAKREDCNSYVVIRSLYRYVIVSRRPREDEEVIREDADLRRSSLRYLPRTLYVDRSLGVVTRSESESFESSKKRSLGADPVLLALSRL